MSSLFEVEAIIELGFYILEGISHVIIIHGCGKNKDKIQQNSLKDVHVCLIHSVQWKGIADLLF